MTYYNCSSIHLIFIFVRAILFTFANFCLGWIHVEEVKSFSILKCPFFGVTRVVWGGPFKFSTIFVEIGLKIIKGTHLTNL
ncbi:unnamed protein product [Sphagnum jensenii]|uniref:Uncharacterized protein n=1 Tax=Sphagnum jensenii TaxID=128206 RepID=A0ABP1APX2_9BRYO